MTKYWLSSSPTGNPVAGIVDIHPHGEGESILVADLALGESSQVTRYINEAANLTNESDVLDMLGEYFLAKHFLYLVGEVAEEIES